MTITEVGNFGNNFSVHPRATVYSPTIVEIVGFNGTATQAITLTEAGIHLVRINANNLVSIGNYEIVLACIPLP